MPNLNRSSVVNDRIMSRMSRRRFLNAAAGAGTASVAGLAVARIAPASAAGRSTAGRSTAANTGSLADAVLGAFTTRRLVALGEWHGFQEHHDALRMLLADPRLPEVVDDIVVEFGDAFYQPMMDKFILGLQPVNNADLRLAWRNTTLSPLATWDEPVYEQFFRTVRSANWALPPGKRMRVLLGDPPIDWPKVTKPSQIPPLPSRDTYPASLVESHVLRHGRRALLCYGSAHVFHRPPHFDGPGNGNMVTIIEQHTGQRTYTITDLVPWAGDPGGLARKLAPHPRNTVIPAAGTWLGSFDAALVASGVKFRPHHGQPCDPYCDYPASSIIDAGLYLGQPAGLTQSYPNPAIYLDPTYWAELQRRNALLGNPANLDSYRHEQPTKLPLIKTTLPAGCGQPPQPS
jgi:hypothetical protein